jgi:hypothetical protein
MARSFNPDAYPLLTERQWSTRPDRDLDRERPDRFVPISTAADHLERGALNAPLTEDDESRTMCSGCSRDGLDLTDGVCEDCAEVLQRIAARNKAEADFDDYCDRRRKERAERGSDERRGSRGVAGAHHSRRHVDRGRCPVRARRVSAGA